MIINDDTLIEYTVSGRMQVLTDTWAHVRERYVAPCFGADAVIQARLHLESGGQWKSTVDGETLYLKIQGYKCGGLMDVTRKGQKP